MGIPFVILVHNLYAWQTYSSYTAVGGRLPAALLRLATRRSARSAAAVLAVSKACADRVSDKVLVTGVVHNGCSLEEAARSSGDGPLSDVPMVVIIVANIAPHKGIEVLIDGVAQAIAMGHSVELQIYGTKSDPVYVRRLEALAQAKLGKSPFRGPIYGTDLVDAYRACHVLAVGSSFETFCNPLVEGMRSGCVVVAPESRLVQEICGDVAIGYNEGNAGSFALALEAAGKDWGERSRRGVERSRAFTWAGTAEKTIGYVRDTVKHK